MFNKIIKYLKLIKKLKGSSLQYEKLTESKTVHKKIEVNLAYIKEVLGKNNDLIIREFNIGADLKIKAFLCCIDGLVNKELINEYIEKSLMININLTDYADKLPQDNILDIIEKSIINITNIKKNRYLDNLIMAVLSGNTVLFVDGAVAALNMGIRDFKSRAIEQSDTEVTIRGSREGFTEVLDINTSMLRRRIKNRDFIIEKQTLGVQTNTDIAIAYVEGIVNKKVLVEVKERLKGIKIDIVLESGYIEQLIEDNPLSLFATIGNSEKPDKVAAKILEGRVAILCDGTPFVLTVPHVFIENFQISQDYYSRAYISSFMRLIRLLAFLVSLTTPALYVALTTFHQEMIPTIFLITAAAAREGIPFPTLVESLIMGMMFELIRESGLRLPRQIGQAVSIVGALVIGEAAVQAGIISAPMVIIGALTGISSFIIPSLIDAILFFRIIFTLLSGVFGLYGFIIGGLVMLAHMCSLRSFGTPYLAPIAPFIWQGLKDSFIRFPLWLMETRSKSISEENVTRQGVSQGPKKPERSDDN